MDRQGKWSLSPAYDVSWAYNPKGIWTSNHQMSINNKSDEITRDDLLSVARNVNIKHADQIIDQVIESVSHWPDLAKENGIPDDIAKAINSALLLHI